MVWGGIHFSGRTPLSCQESLTGLHYRDETMCPPHPTHSARPGTTLQDGNTTPHNPVTDFLQESGWTDLHPLSLHWLPINVRIKYKISSFCFSTILLIFLLTQSPLDCDMIINILKIYMPFMQLWPATYSQSHTVHSMICQSLCCRVNALSLIYHVLV